MKKKFLQREFRQYYLYFFNYIFIKNESINKILRRKNVCCEYERNRNRAGIKECS